MTEAMAASILQARSARARAHAAEPAAPNRLPPPPPPMAPLERLCPILHRFRANGNVDAADRDTLSSCLPGNDGSLHEGGRAGDGVGANDDDNDDSVSGAQAASVAYAADLASIAAKNSHTIASQGEHLLAQRAFINRLKQAVPDAAHVFDAAAAALPALPDDIPKATGILGVPIHRYVFCGDCESVKRCEFKDTTECPCGKPWADVGELSLTLDYISLIDVLRCGARAPMWVAAMLYRLTRQQGAPFHCACFGAIFALLLTS